MTVLGDLAFRPGPRAEAPTEDAPADGAAVEEHAPAEEAPAEDAGVPADHKSALTSAETCSDLLHIFKQGIFDQLTSEYGGQFTVEQADYAIENLNS